MVWFLILQSVFAEHNSLAQFGPFTSQAACESAAEQTSKKLMGQVRFVCVPAGQNSN